MSVGAGPGDPQQTSNRARVLYVEANRDGTVGGSHRILHDLIVRLDDRVEPIVLFYQDNPFADRLRDAGVEVLLWDAVCEREERIRRNGSRLAKLLDYGRAILRRRTLLRTLRVDILHLNNSIAQGNDDWLPAARIVGVPCVVTAMGDARPALDPVHRWLAFRFDRVVCISRYLYDALRNYGFPQDRLVLARTGIDVAAIRARQRRPAAEVRADLGVPADACMVAMVGNLRPWKGQHVVIDALGRLGEETRRGLVVVFVGDVGPEYETYHAELVEAVARAGLDASVRFAGHRDDVHDILAAADIGLHASVDPEPFGLVVAEALAAGIPVIAADEGGPVEVVTRATGRAFRMGDADSLAAALTELAADPELRYGMGRAAWEDAERYDIAGFARGVQAVYEDLRKG